MDEKKEGWAIDHKVNLVQMISLLVVLIGYAYVGVQAVTKIDARLSSAEVKVEQHSNQIDKINTERDGTRDRLARLEEKMGSMLDLLQRIDRRIEANRRSELDVLPPELKR